MRSNRLSNLFVLVAILVLALVLVAPAKAASIYYDFAGLRYSVQAQNYTGNTGMYASASMAMNYGTVEYSSMSLQSRWVYDPSTGTYVQDPTKGTVYMSASGILKKPWGETQYIGESMDINSKVKGIRVYMSTGNGIYDANARGAAPADDNKLVPTYQPDYWSSANANFDSSNFVLDGSANARYNEWWNEWDGTYRFNMNFEVPVVTIGGYGLGSEPMGVVAVSSAVPEPSMMLLGFAPLLLLVRRPQRRPVLCNS